MEKERKNASLLLNEKAKIMKNLSLTLFCLPILFISCNYTNLEGEYKINNLEGNVIHFNKDGTCQFCYKYQVNKILGVKMKCTNACTQGRYIIDGNLIDIQLQSRSDCPNIEENGGFYKIENPNDIFDILVRPSIKDLPKRTTYRYPYTIVYRQHAINDKGMYENRNIPKGRDCNDFHITRSNKEDIKDCTEMNVFLYVRFFDEDSIVVRRFYSDAAEYEEEYEKYITSENLSDYGKKFTRMVLDDKDLLPLIYSKTECNEISLKKNFIGTENFSFTEKVVIANNTNSGDHILTNKFKLRFMKFNDENVSYRSNLYGFEIDNNGNKHEVVFAYNILNRLSYEDGLFLENWDEEWAWVEGRDGRWFYENFSD